MTSTDLASHADTFQIAVRTRDFVLAQQAFREYMACFQRCTRTLPEIESAMALLNWGFHAAKGQKAQIAEELMLLRRIYDAYRPPRHSQTWRVEG